MPFAANSCGSATNWMDWQTASSITSQPGAHSSTLNKVKKGRDPWAAKRCPGNRDPDPTDTSAKACLTDGQISTLEMVYSPYLFATPLANGVKQFGRWVPNTDPSGSGL